MLRLLIFQSKRKKKILALGVVNKLKFICVDIVQVFRNYVFTVTLFLLECHLNQLKSFWQKLDRQKLIQLPGLQSLTCGCRFCAFNVNGQQMAAACHLHVEPLRNPSPIPADWEVVRKFSS